MHFHYKHCIFFEFFFNFNLCYRCNKPIHYISRKRSIRIFVWSSKTQPNALIWPVHQVRSDWLLESLRLIFWECTTRSESPILFLMYLGPRVLTSLAASVAPLSISQSPARLASLTDCFFTRAVPSFRSLWSQAFTSSKADEHYTFRWFHRDLFSERVRLKVIVVQHFLEKYMYNEGTMIRVSRVLLF